MCDTLQVDTQPVGGVGTRLTDLAHGLDRASADAADLGEAIGEDELAGEVRGVAVSWDDKRRALAETTRDLGQACRTVAATFTDTDQTLGDAASTKGRAGTAEQRRATGRCRAGRAG